MFLRAFAAAPLHNRFDDVVLHRHKKMASSVAASMPPNTAVPSDRRDAAPAPVATNNGTTPRMKAKDVIKMGRSRSLAACNAASRTGMRSRSWLSLANSTMRIAFFAASPISVTIPICV